MTESANWVWLPIVLLAAAAQTVRNAAQRSLTASAGTLPATLVRFVYGLPFAALGLLVVAFFAPALPSPGLRFLVWVTSAGWLTAFALRSAVDVRIAGLVELLYSYALSRKFFRERVTEQDICGIVLVLAGIVVISVV